MIPWLGTDLAFPPIATALDEPNGLLAAGGDLAPERIVRAYRRGIFPWFSDGQPILWWSPDPRMVLFTAEFRVSRSLAKRVRRRELDVRVDTAFPQVIRACATAYREGQGGTWITEEMQEAYGALHERGYAHSVESFRDGRLVGGLYGLQLGRVFFGESMFASETDASKVALAHLVNVLRERDVPMIDCQQETAHLASVGARPIPRAVFAEHLAQLIHSNEPAAPWTAGSTLVPEQI
jgi:leucyl/phenylalanyl-tRNA--protein transferase